MSRFAKILQEKLNLSYIKPLQKVSGGCISEGSAYECDLGTIFVKYNSDVDSKELFHGEFESLKALSDTGTVHLPRPVEVIISGSTCLFVAEFVHMKSLQTFQAKLGKELAELHLHNLESIKSGSPNAISKFGFHIPTCCGKLPLDNNWNEDWIDFYCNQRIKPRVEMASKQSGNKEVELLWNELHSKIPKLFLSIKVQPSLLHGDLWSGNAGETDQHPIIFDPASFYGHHEFDLAITRMFGGFSKEFYDAYHAIIPQEDGFEGRKLLYELFHYINHWNHFGGEYKEQTLNIMRKLNHRI